MKPEHLVGGSVQERKGADASERRPYLWNLERVSLRGRQGPRLHSMTLQVHTGCTAVVGYSGAGKTSLLNLLVGFEKPDAGALTGPAGRVFWAPQNGGLWPHLTVREHFSVIRRGALPDDLLADFDLAHKLDSRPDELSEGEQSRLSVARALWTRAPVLVMDEPLVHVDPARADVCWGAIRRHLTANGASLVFSTHSPEAVLGEAERAVCLKAGRLLYEGTVDDLYARPPDAELAGFLGPTNWFEPGDARVWLGRDDPVPRSWRPEQIAVVPAAAPGHGNGVPWLQRPEQIAVVPAAAPGHGNGVPWLQRPEQIAVVPAAAPGHGNGVPWLQRPEQIAVVPAAAPGHGNGVPWLQRPEQIAVVPAAAPGHGNGVPWLQRPEQIAVVPAAAPGHGNGVPWLQRPEQIAVVPAAAPGHGNGVPWLQRPEQIAVAPDAVGELTVRAVRFRGSVAEVELRHEPTGQERRFYHRPASNRLQVGASATISLLT